jgi:hypothetical protein
MGDRQGAAEWVQRHAGHVTAQYSLVRKTDRSGSDRPLHRRSGAATAGRAFGRRAAVDRVADLSRPALDPRRTSHHHSVRRAEPGHDLDHGRARLCHGEGPRGRPAGAGGHLTGEHQALPATVTGGWNYWLIQKMTTAAAESEGPRGGRKSPTCAILGPMAQRQPAGHSTMARSGPVNGGGSGIRTHGTR